MTTRNDPLPPNSKVTLTRGRWPLPLCSPVGSTLWGQAGTLTLRPGPCHGAFPSIKGQGQERNRCVPGLERCRLVKKTPPWMYASPAWPPVSERSDLPYSFLSDRHPEGQTEPDRTPATSGQRGRGPESRTLASTEDD